MFDYFVLPAKKYSENGYLIGEKQTLNVSIIGYGSQSLLKHAFLAGCKDYLKDPWTPEELFFRVTNNNKTTTFQFFQWNRLKFHPFFCTDSIKTVRFSKTEYIILYSLIKHRGEIVSKSTLSTIIGKNYTASSRAIEMHISSIRKKIGAIDTINASNIETIHGEGYFIG